MPGSRIGRTVLGYAVVLAFAGVVIAWAMVIGSHRTPPVDIDASYRASDVTACLGSVFRLSQSGSFVAVAAPVDAEPEGSLRLQGRRLSGPAPCAGGGSADLSVEVVGEVRRDDGRPVAGPRLVGSLGGAPFEASFEAQQVEAAQGEARSAEDTLGRLMLAIAAVVVASKLVGAVVSRVGQPRVMGEVLAGILLGSTLLGTVAPGVKEYLFPPDIIPLLRGAADIGLVFYMFLVGLELDLRILRGRVEQATFISHASIALPLATGVAIAVPIFQLVGPASSFGPYALFMGIAMSVTAFPVLARILLERRMLASKVGAMAIAAAAVDDVTAWVLIALASGFAVASAGAGGNVALEVAVVVVLLAVFCVVMATVGRRILARAGDAYDEAGSVPPIWIVAILLGVLLSSFVAVEVGVAGIFGAFVMGLIMPRRGGLSLDITRRLDDFVTTLLLPLFFVVTGLNTRVGLLTGATMWTITVVLILAAIGCKLLGGAGAARATGLPWRESAAIGVLMNTRGLTELIVLNLGLDLHVITPALYTMLVLMALVTTFMTGPLLRKVDPDGSFSAPTLPEIEPPADTRPGPTRAVLVAPQAPHNIDVLASIAAPIAASTPQRELVIARLLPPTASASGVLREERAVRLAIRDLATRGRTLTAAGLDVHPIAFTSVDVASDLLRLIDTQPIDLLVIDGRRPLLRPGPPGGSVGRILREAPCDVMVVIERDELADIPQDMPVAVAFGGDDHDWAALELGAWIAASRGATLLLLGAEADPQVPRRDASRLLADASLVIQRLVGVEVEVALVPPGADAFAEVTRDAGLVLLGLSERWHEEGFGSFRSEVVRATSVPVAFVRRGSRPGALAPAEDATRFTWSRTSSAARH